MVLGGRANAREAAVHASPRRLFLSRMEAKVAKVQIVVAVIGFALAIVAFVLVTSGNVEECQRDGHSWAYCYQLLYGRR